ncbi:TonB-dependent receptor [Sphingomonas sinipercae]|uniref:TonB-dependent receptor n=1 Tax=Sphingomonas sinipercae TaxID=2714944 RepID=A0A6G7ZNG9_9SPHN|nr:TonB-dependent receptor [Sphingomonas sinipercae]QIL02521.1 TonB-dependent receptor [Sphingomonas sinipercae]
MILLLLAQSAATPPFTTNPDEIVVVASRAPEEQADAAASASVTDRERIERLGSPLVDAMLRLIPSASIATSGPAGSFTEVRIRGSEANHTLLFLDGIRANDPAAGNAARFELLNSDLVSRIEVVRGPQSALWGSEAIGGVIAVDGSASDQEGFAASSEAGSFGFARASGNASVRTGPVHVNAGAAWQRATGIDSFSGLGDRDGYRNLSGRLRATWSLSPDIEVGVSAFSLTGRTEYDGIDLLTFIHSDTLDVTRNRLSAGRVWAQAGRMDQGFRGIVSTSLLGSSNRNALDGEELNRTKGRRWTASGQFEYRFSTGALAHTAIVALDHDREDFGARDVLYGGFTNQDRKRTHDAITAEWRSEAAPGAIDVAVRKDRFSDFKDSTTLRASVLGRVSGNWSVAASYGEGIAQPTFFDLYGFFPGTYLGNPDLKPERSRGYEASLRYRDSRLSGSLTAFRQRLEDEIVDDPTFTSTLNSTGISHRSGVEAELAWKTSDRLRLSGNYAYLKADQPTDAGVQAELRRPRHSGSVTVDGRMSRWSYGASVSYVGARRDRQELPPYAIVGLDRYILGNARIAYRLSPTLDIFARVSNVFDEDYRDAVDYRTEGRGAFAGIRLTRF